MTTLPLFTAFAPPIRPPTALRRAITAAYRRSEPECLAPLLQAAELPADLRSATSDTARELITALRSKRRSSGVEALLQEYALSSQEGVALMCLAEALLRIPDDATRDALIRDKLADGDWGSHLGGERPLFVNATTWGLVVAGRLVESADDRGLAAALTRLIARAGEPVIRRGVNLAMRMLGEQFVAGETIGEALQRSREREARGFSYSYDMLGEAATTAADAARYYAAYETAIHEIGKVSAGRGIHAGPGISIKLSALHPRYSRAQAERVMTELLPRVKALALHARAHDIGLNIDAEEADRLELSLDVLESLALDPELTGWQGLGFAVQAYGKRCPFVIDWIIDLARRAGRRIMVRLVKGAYWDAEIKRAQVDGLADFPVYTRKDHTDVAYIACAKRLLGARDAVYPQFATHNAQTLATIHQIAGPRFAAGDWEFQCLHGMGEALYDEVVGRDKLDRPCRIYAPVGTHETLLAYLVRRLLENGANSSFVNRIADPDVAIEDLLADPVERVRSALAPGRPHDAIALPADLYGTRRNSAGIDLTDEQALAALSEALQHGTTIGWTAGSAGTPRAVLDPADRRDVVGTVYEVTEDAARAWTAGSAGTPRTVLNPADRRDVVGTVYEVKEDAARAAATRAAASDWPATPVAQRAAMLERAADAMQARMPTLLGLIVREAGKSLPNAIAEVREAIDFLRYYAEQARALLSPGPLAEGDTVQAPTSAARVPRSMGPRAQSGTDPQPLGPVVCISPWNFPLAIFTGQVAAALAAGNPVLAKPAEETPLIAAEGVRLLHAAGVPPDALQLVPGDGRIGAALVAASETAGVMFTGSTAVARLIQTQLAWRLSPQGQPIPLIAETGGQNVMIVDSSALAEQVVADVIASAFDSAGQRCSALRLLCLQEDIAERTLQMLRGALAELRIGHPDRLAVDIGPVITAEARAAIEAHVAAMRARGLRVEQLALPAATAYGTFVPPTIIELNHITDLEREVFGPVLHVIRYRRESLDRLIDAINATGYGLTFGLHTRLDDTIAAVTSRIRAGNLYINRNIIGAVVGVQPFGGCGLSGTGPKAGGPLYLRRLVRDHGTQAPLRTTTRDDRASADLTRWLDDQGEAAAARLARLLDETSPLGLTRELPGPVGERNLYALRPRGTILLKPVSRTGLWHQLAAVLATGNDFAIEADASLIALLDDLPASIGQRRREPTTEMAAALIEGDGDRVTAALRELADRPGAVVTAQAASSTALLEPGAYRAEWLAEEVSTSINTTAAGGNASLMMLA